MANIIDGKKMAAFHKKRIANTAFLMRQFGMTPCLAVVVVGDDPASQVYVRGKIKDCEECHIDSRVIKLSKDITQEELIDRVFELAEDDEVHGILVQLPLPNHIDEYEVLSVIPPTKDVDGFGAKNMGNLLLGQPMFVPCTPAACLWMIKSTGIEIAGKHAVIVGRSNIVGKPMAMILLKENATVTICHSYTENLAAICKTADILVVAVGHTGLITGDMIKPGAVVIDVGINRGEDGKLHGDVDFDAACEKASFITPVPGGVGLMTRAMLMRNTINACRMIESVKEI